MAKRMISVRLDDELLRSVRRSTKARSDSEALRQALERVREEERVRRFWRRWAGKGGPDAFGSLAPRRS